MLKPTSPHAAEILGDLWEAVGIDPHELTQTGRAASDQAHRIYQAAIASDSIIPSADEATEHHEILDGARLRAVGRFIDLGRAYLRDRRRLQRRGHRDHRDARRTLRDRVPGRG